MTRIVENLRQALRHKCCERTDPKIKSMPMTVFYAPGCIRAKISPQLNGAFARGDTIRDLKGMAGLSDSGITAPPDGGAAVGALRC